MTDLEPLDTEILFEGYVLRAEGSLVLTMEKRSDSYLRVVETL